MLRAGAEKELGMVLGSHGRWWGLPVALGEHPPTQPPALELHPCQ